MTTASEPAPDLVAALAVSDPGRPGPAVVLSNAPGMDSPGHGFTLPLVGRVRPHVYDVVFDQGRRRVFADTLSDTLDAMLPGDYAALSTAYDAAERALASLGPDDAEYAAAVEAEAGAAASLFLVRRDNADALRVQLQTRINIAAQHDGSWEDLDEEEQEVLTGAASGSIPLGVIYLIGWDTTDGEATQIEQGYWSAAVPLVVNRGDYGDYDPNNTPEPESDLAEMIDGRRYNIGGRHPENLLYLDPTSEESYLESLARLQVVRVIERPVDVPDDLFSTAYERGEAIPA